MNEKIGITSASYSIVVDQSKIHEVGCDAALSGTPRNHTGWYRHSSWLSVNKGCVHYVVFKVEGTLLDFGVRGHHTDLRWSDRCCCPYRPQSLCAGRLWRSGPSIDSAIQAIFFSKDARPVVGGFSRIARRSRHRPDARHERRTAGVHILE